VGVESRRAVPALRSLARRSPDDSGARRGHCDAWRAVRSGPGADGLVARRDVAPVARMHGACAAAV